jgi:hypothetical protein
MKKISMILLIFWGLATVVRAEQISNYSNCEVCPGAIHYGVDEAKPILGEATFDMVLGLTGFKGLTLKIDLDGSMAPATGSVTTDAYEIEIKASQEVVYIKDLRDGSYIHLVTDVQSENPPSGIERWHPEIYLQASHDTEIELSDPLPIAWEKFKAGSIYRWIMAGDSTVSWSSALQEKIRFGLAQVLAYRYPA